MTEALSAIQGRREIQTLAGKITHRCSRSLQVALQILASGSSQPGTPHEDVGARPWILGEGRAGTTDALAPYPGVAPVPFTSRLSPGSLASTGSHWSGAGEGGGELVTSGVALTTYLDGSGFVASSLPKSGTHMLSIMWLRKTEILPCDTRTKLMETARHRKTNTWLTRSLESSSS